MGIVVLAVGVAVLVLAWGIALATTVRYIDNKDLKFWKLLW